MGMLITYRQRLTAYRGITIWASAVANAVDIINFSPAVIFAFEGSSYPVPFGVEQDTIKRQMTHIWNIAEVLYYGFTPIKVKQ